MPDYYFYQKDKQILALEKHELDVATQLIAQGYEKQFEEVEALDKKQAFARLADIRNEKQIDSHNFLAGAATEPLIGVMTAAASYLFKKK